MNLNLIVDQLDDDQKKELASLLEKDNKDGNMLRVIGVFYLSQYYKENAKLRYTENDAKKGNTNLNHKFKEGITRKDIAIKSGFYFEAATLLENLFFNRLASLYGKYHKYSLKDHKNNDYNFSGLINQVDELYGSTPLLKSINKWRRQRNKIVHAFFDEQITVDVFLNRAKKDTEKGNELLTEFMNWCRVQKTLVKRYEEHIFSPRKRRKFCSLTKSLTSTKLDSALKQELEEKLGINK